jgi:hypothetical protein
MPKLSEATLEETQSAISRYELPDSINVNIESAEGVLAKKYFSVNFTSNGEVQKKARYRNSEPNFMNKVIGFLNTQGKQRALVNIDYTVQKEWGDYSDENGYDFRIVKEEDGRQAELDSDIMQSIKDVLMDTYGIEVPIVNLEALVDVTHALEYEDDLDLDESFEWRKIRSIEQLPTVTSSRGISIKISSELPLNDSVLRAISTDIAENALYDSISNEVEIPKRELSGPFFEKEALLVREVLGTLSTYQGVVEPNQLASLMIDNLKNHGVALPADAYDKFEKILPNAINGHQVMSEVKDMVTKENLKNIAILTPAVDLKINKLDNTLSMQPKI